MDTTETTLESTTDSFGTELAKSFAVSAASTAGMIVGLAAIGFAKQKWETRRKAKDANVTPAE